MMPSYGTERGVRDYSTNYPAFAKLRLADRRSLNGTFVGLGCNERAIFLGREQLDDFS